jgi:ABC-type transporter Mla subunit MlaD
MRRLALIGAVLLAVAAGAVAAMGASSGGGDPYKVRAMFDDAAFVVQGEDVRIAGAPVGSITGLDVCVPSHGPCAPGTLKKAAVTLEIDKAGFTPFHADAHCAIRPQSLIGEKYVDCTPGTASAPPLQRITRGSGTGSYLLPVTSTSSPVETDIVQDIYRQPTRQQFAIILNELGTGLAARGSDLNAVIHRANPALGYTDQVLRILARQNHQLAQLARDSDAVLTPLAQVRQQIADFVVQGNTTSVASAARANDIARSFQLLPSFLRQLRPLMADLGTLADQATPDFTVLSQSAPALAAQYQSLAPFARVARSALVALGASAVKQQPALISTIPLAKRLRNLGNAGVPSFNLLDRLTASFDRSGGIEQLMGVLFYGATAANGFDSIGHYVRTEALIGGCTGYAKTPVPGCSANFTQASASAASALNANQTSAIKASVANANQATAKTESARLSGLLRYLIGSDR